MVVEPDLLTRGFAATDEELGIEFDPEYTVYVRGANFKVLDVIDTWTSLKLTKRFNDVGTWSIVMSDESLSAGMMLKTGGIVVTRNDEIIFSGSVSTEWAWTNNEFRASGYDDMELLELPVRPNPETNEGPFTNEFYTVTESKASTAFLSAVDDMMGPSAPTKWRYTNLVYATDPLLGSGASFTLRGNFQPLLLILAEAAVTPQAGGIGFRLQQKDLTSGQLEFTVYEPEDKSAQAKFSIELDTAQDFEDVFSAVAPNHFFVGLGDGLGANRTIRATENTDAIAALGRRKSVFVDARGVQEDSDEADQKLEELREGATPQRRVTIVPFELPALRFGRDWDLGTLVTFVRNYPDTLDTFNLPDEEFVDYIREVEFNFIPNGGVRITPMLGQAGATNDERSARYIATMRDRVSNIERNYNIPNNSITPEMLTDYHRVRVGDLRVSARDDIPSRWLECKGQVLSRTTYALLFAAIGTAYGAGDGSTTFAIPNMTGKMVVGEGGSFTLGQSGGAPTINLPDHDHDHSHGGGNLVWTHAHTERDHWHPIDTHYHKYTADHNHPENRTDFTDSVNLYLDIDLDHGGSEFVAGHHDHAYDLPNLNANERNTQQGIRFADDSPIEETGAKGVDIYETTWEGSGPNTPNGSPNSWAGGTDSDDTAGGAQTDISVQNPYVVATWMIYAGV